MLTFKRFGRLLLCLVLCLACLTAANPVSALSTLSVPNGTVVVQPDLVIQPAEEAAAAEQSTAQLVSYVHYSASSSSTVIGCLADGTAVTVLGTKNSFYQIDCYDMVGYIAMSQVTQNEVGEYLVQAAEDSADSAYLPTFSAQETLELRTELTEVAKQYIGVRYLYGGTSPRGFDCSGYTQYVFAKLGISLNRTAAQQASNGIIVSREDMQPGDLVIFSNTDGYRFGTHIGIYLGNGKVIHSGASRGVCIVDMDVEYFDSHFECARRVIIPDSSAASVIPTVSSITGDIGSSWRN